MKHLANIQSEFLKYSSLYTDIKKLKKINKSIVFLGGLCDHNEWRIDIKKQFNKNLAFIDPFDDNWKAEKNIYDECFAMLNSDYVIFYKGGQLTKKEKELLNNSNKEFKEFDNLTDLKKYLKLLTNLNKS